MPVLALAAIGAAAVDRHAQLGGRGRRDADVLDPAPGARRDLRARLPASRTCCRRSSTPGRASCASRPTGRRSCAPPGSRRCTPCRRRPRRSSCSCAGTWPAADRHHGRCVRVHVVDPPAYTPPYDHALCAALARAGADVTLVTSRFRFGPVPADRRLPVREALLPAGRRRRLAARRLGRLAHHVPGHARYGARAARGADLVAPPVAPRPAARPLLLPRRPPARAHRPRRAPARAAPAGSAPAAAAATRGSTR